MLPHTWQMLLQQRLSFLARRTANSPPRKTQLPLHGCPLETHLESWARAPGEPRPNPGLGPSGRRQGGSGERRAGTAGSDLPTLPQTRSPRLPPAGRVHAYLLCSGETDFPGAQEEERTTLAIGQCPRSVRLLLGGLRPLRP